MGARTAERQIQVEASPSDCFRALVDFESYPDWQDAVKECDVRSRDSNGRGRRVAFVIDAKVRSVGYTLDYAYEEPHLITWEFVEGDVSEIEGEYVLEDLGDGTTLATYSLRIDPGVWMPGPLAKVLNDQVMRRSVEDLKARVEDGA
ncbi:MAG: SRPBCC family protein [Thermoleophilaceae bacterium]|nr:SRPBCC family protein [Thermoleophilaceae bacterium]